GGRVTPTGDPGRGQLLDVAFEDSAIVVGEVGGSVCRCQAEGSHEEGRHHGTGDGTIRAVLCTVGRVAAAGDSRRRQPLDVLLEDAGVVVGEVGRSRGQAQIETTHEERRHLATTYVALGTELGVVGRVTAPGDTGSGQPGNVVVEN